MPANFPRCGNCVFWLELRGTDSKVCKRFPPAPKWLEMSWLEWCGEYKVRPEKDD